MNTQSDELNHLASALAKAQGVMKPAGKGKENPFFKSHYADLPSIWEACRKPLSDNGLSVSQVSNYQENEVWLETILLHSSGQWLKSRYPVRPVKSDPQSLGSAQTYARRYALAAMVGIVAEDEDDDGNQASERTLPQSSPYSANPAPRNGNGASDPAAAAKKWAKDAIDGIRSFKDMADLSAWEARNEKALERLSTADAKLHDDVMGALADRYQVLNPLSA